MSNITLWTKFLVGVSANACLLSSVVPWGGPMIEFLKLRSADCLKMHFSWIFLGILELYGDFWRKVDLEDTCNFPLCVFV